MCRGYLKDFHERSLGPVQSLPYGEGTTLYVECPTYGWLRRLVASRFDLSGFARKRKRTLPYSWVKIGTQPSEVRKCRWPSQVHERKDCGTVLGGEFCEKDFGWRTHNPPILQSFRGSHPRMQNVRRRSSYDVSDPRLTHRAAHKCAPSEVRTKSGLSRESRDSHSGG
jgi:hypothetical protein